MSCLPLRGLLHQGGNLSDRLCRRGLPARPGLDPQSSRTLIQTFISRPVCVPGRDPVFIFRGARVSLQNYVEMPEKFAVDFDRRYIFKDNDTSYTALVSAVETLLSENGGRGAYTQK